jgi:hypothetical protein
MAIRVDWREYDSKKLKKESFSNYRKWEEDNDTLLSLGRTNNNFMWNIIRWKKYYIKDAFTLFKELYMNDKYHYMIASGLSVIIAFMFYLSDRRYYYSYDSKHRWILIIIALAVFILTFGVTKLIESLVRRRQ